MGDVPYRIHIRQGEFELDVEGDRAFVEAYIEAFMSDAAMIEEEIGPSRGRGSASGRRQKTGGKRVTVPEIDVAALNAFISPRAKTTNKERYLLYTKFWKTQGVSEITDAYVQACFQAQGLEIPPTGRQNFSTLRDEGLITSGSKRGTWSLTAKAEGAMEEPKGKPASKASGKGAKRAGKKRKKAARRKPATQAATAGAG
jgi:hypothetical protein